VFKKFILGSLLVAGLTACPIEPIVPVQPVSPTANDDIVEISVTQTSKMIEPAANDKKGDAELDPSSIDLNTTVDGQQKTYKDTAGLGTFTLNASGVVTFTPSTGGKPGKALARYRIKDFNGNVSGSASISVTISSTVLTGNIKVLFIGNSRTFYEPCSTLNGPHSAYNIPSMVENMSVNENRKLEVYVVTVCGRTLAEHFGTTNAPGVARAPIAQKGWEYVVLQAATDETASATQAATISVLQQYRSAIVAANPNAKIVLSENWSLKDSQADQSRLTTFYQTAADNLNTAKIAPIGRGWRQPGFLETQLFINDTENKHATTLGAYIAASTYFSLFYSKQAPTTTGVPSSLSSVDASTARANAYNAYSSPSMSKYR
jgi:Surface adhesin CshA repetitive domain